MHDLKQRLANRVQLTSDGHRPYLTAVDEVFALHAMFYNFVRIHQTLKITPAMAAGVAFRSWDITDVVEMLEASEAKEKREAKPIFEIDHWRLADWRRLLHSRDVS